VRQLRSRKSVTIQVTAYWNVFEDGAAACSDYSAEFRRDSDILTAGHEVIARALMTS
jgi:hypothetical protein